MSCHLGGTHHPGYSGEVKPLRILGIPTVRPTAHIEWRWSLQSKNWLSKELVEPAVTRPTARIPVITMVNPCRRDLSRGVRIAVTNLTPFLPIRSYG
ncbi:hypothetical protein PIB30_011465 [Stylosanthes scabra]|uniref:Uncharacterized protein n=1 Tax=Stylosanthes scabra TaxID=79078 RepID=A0ABU6R6N7_9FABA|nr:hypothetical protein [Stylosanthes scabra]